MVVCTVWDYEAPNYQFTITLIREQMIELPQNPTLPIHGVMPRFPSVLSLFDGMSCGQIALNRVGIEYDNYFASEIDKHAIKVTQANYPKTIQLGDVTKVKGSDLPKIDLLIGGSPCQGFSFAGKGLNFEDPRSKLFFEFVRLKNETQPKYWMLENVKMKAEHQNIISEILGVKPILINSSLVSAQNRERLYWTNVPITKLPTNKGLLLKDILEYGSGKKLTEQTAKRPRTLRNFRHSNQKAFCMLATMWKGSQSNGMTVVDDNGLRNITPLECERLQTAPDGYTSSVADTNRYTMLGNGWTVDVIAHIFGSLLNGA
jgi:site-specific DNA-cytosine methylase